MPEPETAPHWTSDEILTALQRESTGINQFDLIEETGLLTDDLREGIADLEGRGLIEAVGQDAFGLTADGAALAGAASPSPKAPDAAPAPAESSGSGAALGGGSLAALMGQGQGIDLDRDTSGMDYRLTLEVTGSFGKARGESTESALERAQAIAEEIGNMLGVAMPSFIGRGSVAVERLEALETKVLFDSTVPQPED